MKPEIEIKKRLYSVKEASTYLGRSPWSVAEMVRTGKLKYIRDGKRIFLDIQDITLWIETSKTQNID
jgi:excisionase family DNA binding protein